MVTQQPALSQCLLSRSTTADIQRISQISNLPKCSPPISVFVQTCLTETQHLTSTPFSPRTYPLTSEISLQRMKVVFALLAFLGVASAFNAAPVRRHSRVIAPRAAGNRRTLHTHTDFLRGSPPPTKPKTQSLPHEHECTRGFIASCSSLVLPSQQTSHQLHAQRRPWA